MAVVEKLEAEVLVKATPDKQSFNEASDFVKKENKRLNSEAWIKLSLNLSELQRQMKKLKEDLKIATNAWDIRLWDKIQSDINRVSQQLRTAQAELTNFAKRWDTAVSWVQKRFDSLSWSIRDVWGLLSWVFSIQKLTGVSDTFYSMQNALKQVTDSEEQLNYWQQRLLKTANESRAPVDDLTKAFVRFDLVNRQIWWTQEETLTILDSLSKGLTMTWATASETWAVMLQLSQAFWSGVLQWDEFRSVAENMPMILDILAKKLWVSRWELKAMASDGVITSQILKEALIEANDQINQSFEKSSKTIWQALTQIRNDFIVTFWELDKNGGVTGWIVTGLEFIKNSVLAFAQVFPWLTWIVGAGTIALGLFWWALTLLWWPITLIIWLISTLVLSLWYLSYFENQMWSLQLQVEQNKIAQDELKKAYDDWKISLENYQKESAKLIWTQEDLKKKNTELEWSFWYMFAKIVALVRSSWMIVSLTTFTILSAIWETIWNLIWMIIENVKLVPYNFWVAFNNIPWAIEFGLKKALKLVGSFIDKITLWLWWVISDKLWIWKIVDDLNIFWSKQLQFKWVWISKEDFKITKTSIELLTDEFNNFWKVVAKTPIIGGWSIDWKIGWTGWSWTPESTKKAKEELDKEKKAYEKWLDSMDKLREANIKKGNDKLRDRAKILEEWYKEASEVYKDAMKESEKATDDFIKKIDDSVKAFDKLQQSLKDLRSWKTTDLSGRFTDVEDEIKKAQEDLKKMQTTDGISLNYAQQFGLDTLKQIWENSEIWDYKVWDLIKVLELNNQLNKLLEEQKLIKNNLSDDEIKEAQRQASLSPTQKILEEYEAKKMQIENEINLERMRIWDLEIQKKKEEEIYANLLQEQAILDENYKNIRISIESQITDDLKNQTVQRIDLLEKIRLKAMQTAEAIRNAGMSVWSPGNNNLNTTNNSTSNSNNGNNSNNTVIINAQNKDDITKALEKYNKWMP